MYYTVDRFEGEFAVLIDVSGNVENVLKKHMADDIKEGDTIILDENGTYVKDLERTGERRQCISKMMDRLWE